MRVNRIPMKHLLIDRLVLEYVKRILDSLAFTVNTNVYVQTTIQICKSQKENYN